MKTFRVIVPYEEQVFGRLIYLVEANSAEEAIEAVREDTVEVFESMVDGNVGDSFAEFPEEAEAEEWS